MLKHKGTSLIETGRLTLRRFTIDDVEDMFNNWANDAEVTKYLTWPPHKNVDVTKEVVNSWIKRYENIEFYNWAIVPNNYGKVIGSISIVELSNHKENCEIGYCMAKSYWNQGIMSESLKAVINYLIFEVGFKRVQAIHNINNPASGKVMLKSGMKYEGKLRKYNKNNQGILVDCDIYSILEEDFDSVSLHENGMYISTSLNQDYVFLEWSKISGLKIFPGKHWLIDVIYHAGRIQLQAVKQKMELNEFVEIIKKANPDLQIEYVKTDKSKVFDINTKRQAKRYQKQEMRVEAFVASLETDDEAEILKAWEEQLKVNLEFPFVVETVDNSNPLQVDKALKVTGLDGFENMYGIIAVIKVGRKKYWLPLCELVPVDKDSENYHLIDDYCFWFCSR